MSAALSPTLQALIDEGDHPHFGMVPGAAWDSIMMLRKEDWNFELMVSWHFACWFGEASPEAQEAHSASLEQP